MNEREAAIKQYIQGVSYQNKDSEIYAFECVICNRTILDLRRYRPQDREEYLDMLYDHLRHEHKSQLL